MYYYFTKINSVCDSWLCVSIHVFCLKGYPWRRLTSDDFLSSNFRPLHPLQLRLPYKERTKWPWRRVSTHWILTGHAGNSLKTHPLAVAPARTSIWKVTKVRRLTAAAILTKSANACKSTCTMFESGLEFSLSLLRAGFNGSQAADRIG